MKSKVLKILIICLMFVTTSCIEKFAPEIDRYEAVFIVDGEINNLPGPYEVRLTQSFEQGNKDPYKVRGASITISDDLGNIELLSESAPGVYKTINANFRGQPGRKYKVRIEIGDSAILESEFEELKEPVEIEDVYWEFENRELAGTNGVQIFLDTKDPENRSHYYLWEYEEYWKFMVPFRSLNFYPEEFICWDSSMVHELKIGTTQGFSEDAFKRKSLYFIDNNSNRLSIRYSTLIRQYILSEKTWKFYHSLKALNENTGSLFDPIPYSLTGNMTYLNHEDIPVLGLFQVAGVSEKRIFINRSELPMDFYPDDKFYFCKSVEFYEYEENKIDSMNKLLYSIYDSRLLLGDTAFTIYMASNKECYLCTVYGTNVEPEFWEE